MTWYKMDILNDCTVQERIQFISWLNSFIYIYKVYENYSFSNALKTSFDVFYALQKALINAFLYVALQDGVSEASVRSELSFWRQ